MLWEKILILGYGAKRVLNLKVYFLSFDEHLAFGEH